jgi:hypothetical protein
MKHSTNIRWKHDWIDFCGDGQFRKERIKGKAKRHLGKWSRKNFYKNMDKDYD